MSRIPLAEEAVDGFFLEDGVEAPLQDTDDIQELDFEEYEVPELEPFPLPDVNDKIRSDIDRDEDFD